MERIVTYLSISSAGSTRSQNSAVPRSIPVAFIIGGGGSVVSGSNFVGGTRSESESILSIPLRLTCVCSVTIVREIPR